MGTKGQLTTGKIKKAERIKVRQAPLRGSKYDDILDKMDMLKAGEGFEVPIPRGLDSRTFLNRLGAAYREYGPNPSKGTKFRRRTTADGKRIAITCVKL